MGALETACRTKITGITREYRPIGPVSWRSKITCTCICMESCFPTSTLSLIHNNIFAFCTLGKLCFTRQWHTSPVRSSSPHMDSTLSAAQMGSEAPKWGEEFQPFVARLQLLVIQAEDIMPSIEPYIICVYDHSEVIMTRNVPDNLDDSDSSDDSDSLGDERRGRRRKRVNIHRWKTHQCLYGFLRFWTQN
jgi:hypothetical protein